MIPVYAQWGDDYPKWAWDCWTCEEAESLVAELEARGYSAWKGEANGH